MSDFLVLPPASSIHGAIHVPPSKSVTNRALLAAALAAEPVEIIRPLESGDTAALRACLSAMGASIVPSADGLRVSGPLRAEGGREVRLDVGDSGTAARFLIAAAAATPGRFFLTGSERLRERPVGELVEALRGGGARIAYAKNEGRLPVLVEGASLRSGSLTVDASRSSQFISALLLAGIAVEGGLSVRPSGEVASAPYVRTTIETLRNLGHEVVEGEFLRVSRGRRLADRFETPADYSAAVPLLAAAGAAGGEVTLVGLRWPSTDADAAALPVLEKMGVRIAASAKAITSSARLGGLSAVSVCARDFPDAVPALAALAALAPGESRFSGIGHLRLKESDRISALVSLLNDAGARAVEDDGGLTVLGPLAPRLGIVRLRTFRDHRIAMAAALLALRLPGLLIENPDCVAKSYPGFFRDLETIVARRRT
ncbi:MAG TPA: 3-phosphoshikimate 1-carboxyvinyltransferase [Thermoanaerobaculia bacterium]